MKTEKKKKTLQTGLSAGEYLAPSVKVMKVKTRRVLCSSDQNNIYGGFTNGEQEGC